MSAADHLLAPPAGVMKESHITHPNREPTGGQQETRCRFIRCCSQQFVMLCKVNTHLPETSISCKRRHHYGTDKAQREWLSQCGLDSGGESETL